MGVQIRKSMLGTLAVVLLLNCGAASQALATNFEICVKSDADLANALDQARSVPVTAKIVQHNLTNQSQPYDLKNTVWHNSAAGTQPGTELLGGYTAGCAGRDIAAGNTRIIDSGADPFDAVAPRGDITIEGLTFSLTNALNVGLGNVFYHDVPSGSTILFLRDAFTNASAGGLYIYWEQGANSDSTVRVVDTLIANNTALGTYCALELISSAGAPEFDIINNTVVDNAGANASGACFQANGTNAEFYAYNNIFHGTTGTNAVDLNVDTPLVVQYNNIWGTRSGDAAISSHFNQPGTDPKLDANYRPIVTAPPSPAINAGDNNPQGGLPASDLDGGPRIVGSIVDIGAYESNLDAHPTQTVTKTADDGTAGTLRTAIESVNSNGGGTIKFAFSSGTCPWIIKLTSELQLVASATINGYSATGASPNGSFVGDDASICVAIEADNSVVTPPTRGIAVLASTPANASVAIQGLGMGGFSTTAIDLQGGSGHTVTGNHFGGNINGHTLPQNGYDVRLGSGTTGDVIGGNDFADRNLIGGAANSGLVVGNGSSNNQIIGNYIGIGWSIAGSNYTDRGNGARGIYVAGDNTTISGNLIGHNAQAGIVLDSGGAHDNVITENAIGGTDTGVILGNVGAGIHLIGASGDAPENNKMRFNRITQNGAQGVLVDVGQGNVIRKNEIYENTLLGIDLGAVGFADPQSDDGGIHVFDEANRSQNFPVLTSASGDAISGIISGTLTTTPGDKTVDFYSSSDGCDTSTYGEGRTWLGAITVTVPTPVSGFQGTKSFDAHVDEASPVEPFATGLTITATATDANGNTSEFSACVYYSDDGIFLNGFEGTLE